MQLKQALAQGMALLEKGGVPSPRLTAEVLLMHAARCDRTHLYAHTEQELTQIEWIHYGRYLHERLQGKPTQYITGRQEFWGLDFAVAPSVLIPRPETELVVEAALALARRHFPQGTQCRIADVGTGSGCLAVALATELSHAKIVAFDQSHDALEVAQINARRHGVEQQITFLCSDLLQPSSGETLYGLQMVVSNPPYVSEQDREKMSPEVRNFEPPQALFAGRTGVELYRRLIPQAAEVLCPGGYLVLELGYDSPERVRNLLASPPWGDLEWLCDLAGMVRVGTARCLPTAG